MVEQQRIVNSTRQRYATVLFGFLLVLLDWLERPLANTVKKMTMDNDDVVCNFARDHHAAGLMRLDTSFTSDYVYRVTGDEGSLQLSAVPCHPPQRKAFKIALDDQPWTQGFVAMKGEVLQGFIATAFEAWNRRLVIWHFYVDLHCRRQGVGRRLMNHAFEQGRRQGALTAWLETSNLNYPGVEVYRRLGFSLCGFDTALYIGTPAEGEFALFMARHIGDNSVSVTVI